MIEPINLYNVDYFFEKVTWIDIKGLREDSGEVHRVAIEEPQERHSEVVL